MAGFCRSRIAGEGEGPIPAPRCGHDRLFKRGQSANSTKGPRSRFGDHTPPGLSALNSARGPSERTRGPRLVPREAPRTGPQGLPLLFITRRPSVLTDAHRLPRAVVKVGIPRRPAATERHRELLVVLVGLVPHPKLLGLNEHLHKPIRSGPSTCRG